VAGTPVCCAALSVPALVQALRDYACRPFSAGTRYAVQHHCCAGARLCRHPCKMCRHTALQHTSVQASAVQAHTVQAHAGAGTHCITAHAVTHTQGTLERRSGVPAQRCLHRCVMHILQWCLHRHACTAVVPAQHTECLH